MMMRMMMMIDDDDDDDDGTKGKILGVGGGWKGRGRDTIITANAR